MSPDLMVRITSRSMDARQIGEAEWPLNALWVRPGLASALLPKWLRRNTGQGELFLGAHDILDDKADWNSETWLFDPIELPRFVATIQRLYELIVEDFELVAAWGDEPSREQLVTRTEFVGILSNNELGNAVRYRVSAI